MTEWDRDIWRDGYNRKHGNTLGLKLDDGTYLENFETVLENEYGETETFEIIGLDREFRWYGWGPHDMTVLLRKKTIQSMFDAGDLKVVE